MKYVSVPQLGHKLAIIIYIITLSVLCNVNKREPGSLWRPVLPAFLYCCLRWYQSVQSLLNVKSPNQPAQPGIRPRLSASAPLSTPPGTRPWLSLAERGPSTVTGTSSSSLSSLASLASVSTGCKGVSSKCFGENYIYIICQSVKYYIC